MNKVVFASNVVLVSSIMGCAMHVVNSAAKMANPVHAVISGVVTSCISSIVTQFAISSESQEIDDLFGFVKDIFKKVAIDIYCTPLTCALSTLATFGISYAIGLPITFKATLSLVLLSTAVSFAIPTAIGVSIGLLGTLAFIVTDVVMNKKIFC